MWCEPEATVPSTNLMWALHAKIDEIATAVQIEMMYFAFLLYEMKKKKKKNLL